VTRPLFQGVLIRLAAVNAETQADAAARWSRDPEYSRLLDSDPARPVPASRVKADLEKQEIKNDGYSFSIRTLTGDQLIGFLDLDGIQWSHGNAHLAIGIGERELWGKGYGTDAMQEALRFAFDELNLHRVTLTVFEYNPRAVRTYEKVGFREEGRLRQHLNRDGRRWDMIYMGILRSEWEAESS